MKQKKSKKGNQDAKNGPDDVDSTTASSGLGSSLSKSGPDGSPAVNESKHPRLRVKLSETSWVGVLLWTWVEDLLRLAQTQKLDKPELQQLDHEPVKEKLADVEAVMASQK